MKMERRMHFKKLFIVILAISFMVMAVPQLFAGEIDILVDKLVEKGILSRSEANEVLNETKQEVEQQAMAVKAGDSQLPRWIEKMDVKGSLRLRHHMSTVHPGEDDNKQRLKFSIGATTEVNDKVKLGFGLATGSSDSPTSTNQDLESEFQSKNIWLDYAYAEYEPTEWLTFKGGKFKSPFLHTDMLLDGDIRFDGFAAKATHKILQDSDMPTELFLTAGYFPIDNNSAGESDVYLTVIQGGKKVKFGDFAKLKSGLAYYNFHGLEGYSKAALAEDKGTNTAIAGGIANDFQIISPIMKLTFNDLLGFGFPVSVIGEYAQNLVIDNDDDNDAWRASIEFGGKVTKKEDWQLKVHYSRIERDAFFDAFPDGDFNGGGTNARGWRTNLNYGVADNIVLGINYYSTAVVTGAENDEQILQGDIVLKFYHEP